MYVCVSTQVNGSLFQKRLQRFRRDWPRQDVRFAPAHMALSPHVEPVPRRAEGAEPRIELLFALTGRVHVNALQRQIPWERRHAKAPRLEGQHRLLLGAEPSAAALAVIQRAHMRDSFGKFLQNARRSSLFTRTPAARMMILFCFFHRLLISLGVCLCVIS